MTSKNIVRFIIALIVCQGAGFIGTLFTDFSDGWYQSLEKPFFNPPSWIFGPVWITLYTLMALSVVLVWRRIKDKGDVRGALTFFYIHLVFNALWSILFFGIHNIALAFVDILILLVMIGLVMLRFKRISRKAAYLLVPYLLWVSFATVLNYAILSLN